MTSSEGVKSFKPRTTGSGHVLPFLELSAVAFERLCLWLARAEGFEHPEHYGSGGADQGRDVTAFKLGDGLPERWYFQCKRRATVRSADLKAEIDKIAALTIEPAASGVVFVVAGSVSARQRDAVGSHARAVSLTCSFWARTELDALVKSHPALLAEFFQLGQGNAEHVVESADSALRKGLDAAYEGDLETAVEHFEEAIAIARRGGQSVTERNARLQAARGIGEMIRTRPRGDRAPGLARIAAHLEAAEQLGAAAAAVASERSMAARLAGDQTRAFEWARMAIELARETGNERYRDNALVGFLQLCSSLGRFDEAASVANEVAHRLDSSSGERALVLAVTWLTLRSRAGLGSADDAVELIRHARAAIGKALYEEEPALTALRAAVIVGDAAGEFHRSGRLAEAIALCEFGCELAGEAGSPSMVCNTAVQVAGVAAELGDARKARQFLAKAQAAVDQERILPPGRGDGPGWETLRANVLSARGRTLLRLSEDQTDPAEAETTLREGADALREAIEFAEEERVQLSGPVDDFLADLRWALGQAMWHLDELNEASTLLHAVRTAPAMADPQFAESVGMQAWLLEAESLLWLGRPEDAGVAVAELLASDVVPEEVAKRSQALARYLDRVVLPYRRWLSSPDASVIGESARRTGLRDAVANEVQPLVSWWQEWDEAGDSVPSSELLDLWGRGCFARVAAAISAKPHAAIAVDARSIDEIKRWAWILCPLFDTLLVKWKGELVDALLWAPLREDYGGPGGHGYRVMGGLRSIGPESAWAPAMAWANPLPRDVTLFLATEARALVAAGRLVVVPAPSVGCTQSAVGWTDELLLDGLLGGVVNVISGIKKGSGKGKRVLDLVSHSVPYVAGIELPDLAAVLGEIDEWVNPLRSLLFRSLTSDDLRTEHWKGIAAVEGDIRDACTELHARLAVLAGKGGWRVAQTGATIAAASSPSEQPGSDAVTAVLRSIVGERRELAPWVPYWRLQERGGYLDWSGPLDNPSRPNPEAPSTAQTWLYPGTAGWFMPMVIG